MSLTVAIVLVWAHFVADFVLQSDKVAIAKSSDNAVLARHVAIYMLLSLAVVPFFNNALMWLAFYFVNWAGHFATDYVSSRVCTKLYKAGERHWFFVVIGADQAIHLTTLFATFAWLA